jgi:ABC-type branched-subunit amino acid transport system ATPase component/branched-subunit amino acid ABC-type transport system permease component
MSDVLIFIVAGLAAGSVYALAGVGLVLTYKTSGVFNFAHGALATVAAYCFYTLVVSHGWSWPLAAVVAVLVLGALMGLMLEPFARALRRVSLPMQVAGTVGLLLAVQAIVALIYPDQDLRQVPQFLPQGGFTLAGAPVQWANVCTFAVALAATIALSLVLRHTRSGIATRALVDDDQLLALNAVSPVTVRRGAWITGSILAAASGVLFAPLLPLNSVQLTLLVVSAFGAAAVGRFTSLSLTLVGGLLIGVAASLATRYLTSSAWAGIAPSLPFIALFVVILFRRRSAGTGGAVNVARPGSAWSAPVALQTGLGVVVLGALAAVPSFAGIHLADWSAGLGAVVLFLSLALLVRTSGQVSLCHVAFTAIGAAAFSHFAVGVGMPWPVALVAAGLVAVPIGALLAIPAIRLSGLYLALATFGFGILLQYMFYTRNYMFGISGIGLRMPRPAFSGGQQLGDTGYYYLALILCAVCALIIVGLSRGRLGRLLRGMGDAPTALATTGASVTTTRVLVFCLSAFLAAVAGALIGVARTNVSVSSYPPLLSLTYLALIMIVVGREPWNALLAGLSLMVIPSYLSGGNVPIYMQLIFGASAILVAIGPASAGPPAWLRSRIDTLFRRSKPVAGTVAAASGPATIRERLSGSGLHVSGLCVRFGGIVALDDVEMEVQLGRITGLIGPNGAGKTTLFNACSGLVHPERGTVRLGDRDISRARPADRARRGLGRTYQDMRLFDSLTVRQNVALGREGSYAGRNPLSHLAGRRAANRAVRNATNEAIELCGLTELADQPVLGLSTGQRRLVDLARCLAGAHRLLLLDEPSSGLDVAETAQLGAVARRVVEERGVGVLLVEHDLPLVLDICSHIYVLDFGKLIFAGTPAEVAGSPVIQAAYLGDASIDKLIDTGDATVGGVR